jgi:drug/metabolite transporter (DMT)-like permease
MCHSRESGNPVFLHKCWIPAFITVGFGSWPFAGKYLQISGAWVGTIMIASTLPITALCSLNGMRTTNISVKAIIVLILAGVLNGITLWIYLVKTADPNIPTSIFIVSVTLLISLLSLMLDWGINYQIPDTRQFVGIAMAIGAVILLAK